MSAQAHDSWAGSGARIHKRRAVNADSIQNAVNNYTNTKKAATTTKAAAGAASTKKVASTSSVVVKVASKASSATKAVNSVKSAATVANVPPSHKTSATTAAAGTYTVKFASQGTAPSAASTAPIVASSAVVAPVAVASVSGTVAKAPVASASASAGTNAAGTGKSNVSSSMIPQSGIIAIVVGALVLVVVGLFVTWCCKRSRAKKAEAKWWKLNASSSDVNQGGSPTVPMVNGKAVRVVENSRNRISPEETEKEWGHRRQSEKSPLPSPTAEFHTHQTGPGWGANVGPKAQYQFAAVSRDPSKMQAARDELLSRGPSGKASHLRVNVNAPIRQGSAAKANSPVISSPLEATNPYVMPPPLSATGVPANYPPLQQPAPALMADVSLNASTMTDPADAWAQQASMFPTPTANVVETDGEPRHTLIETSQPRQGAAPRKAQDTVFAIAERYEGGWNRDSHYDAPRVPSPPKEPLPARPARSSSKGRNSQAPSTRGEVVSAFPAPPTGAGVGLGLSRSSSPEGEAPLPSPRLGNLAQTAPLRLSRSKSSGGKPSPILVPSASNKNLHPIISSAPPIPVPNSTWAPPLPSPALPTDRRRSVAMTALDRRPSAASVAPAPEGARPARNASLKSTNTANSPPYSGPPPRAVPQKQSSYGSPSEQNALAALTQRSPRIVTSPVPSEAASVVEASTPASMDTESAFATTPSSSLPATPRDGYFESAEVDSKPTQTSISIPAPGAKQRVDEVQNPGAVFPPLASMTLDPVKNNYRSAALSIYNLYDQE